MQTPREVIDNLMRKKPADRVGLHDSPWQDTLTKWVAQGYPTTPEGEPVPPVDHFEFDLAGCGEGFSYRAKLVDEEIIEQTEDWKIVKDGNGAYLKWWKHKSGTPEHIDFTMTSRKIWEEEYKPHVVGSARKRVTPEIIAGVREALAKQKSRGKWAHYGQQFIWENMRAAFGDICLYESLLLDPAWIHDYCRAFTDLYKECYALMFSEAGMPDGIWIYEDLGYKETMFCSPDTFGDLIFPYFSELVGFFHDHDLPVVLHSCGLTEPVLDLVVEAGFDGLNPMEVKAGNDPLRIAGEFADKLVFIGGLDARILESGDRDLIEREVSGLINGMKDRGARFVYGSDHSISTNVDYGDFQYSLDVYRECMMY